MTEELERILLQITEPDDAVIQQGTAQLKLALKDPAVIPALCTVMTNSKHSQIRQTAAVLLRMRVTKHWTRINHKHRESLKAVVLQAFKEETEQSVHHSISQLSAMLVKHEFPERWPALLALLNQSSKSTSSQDRQVYLQLFSQMVESNPEIFKPHFSQLFLLFDAVLRNLSDPSALRYSMVALTTMCHQAGTEEMNVICSFVPRLITGMKQLIKSVEAQASEAMDAFDKLMESHISTLTPHIAQVIQFCLEVSADASVSIPLRVKALSSLSILIKLKSKTVLKLKLLGAILQTVFPVFCSAPPAAEEDSRDQEKDGDRNDSKSLRNIAAEVIDTMALHMPSELLLRQLMPMTEACLASGKPSDREAGLLCLALLTEGCADHIRTHMLSSVLRLACESLADSSQMVRATAVFALGQFSEHLQPDIGKYSSELIPLLLGYLSGLDHNRLVHISKVYYALENVLENLGEAIQPYLPTLMETMFTTLSDTRSLKIRALSLSAIGAIANSAKEMLVPYFPQVMNWLEGFLTDMREETRSLQTQALDTLSVVARSVGKSVFSPLAAECVRLGLNLTDSVDEPDLRRCAYSLFSAVSVVRPDCLVPHLPAITTMMALSLRSTEGVTAHMEEDPFTLLDEEDDDEGEMVLDEEEEEEEEGESRAASREIAGFSVENVFIDEKEDACKALGELSLNIGTAFLPFLESSFQHVYELHDFPHNSLRKSVFAVLGQFCRAQHSVWLKNPTEVNHQALQKLLSVVLPTFLEAVRQEPEREVVMAALESLNAVIKTCQGEALHTPTRLAQVFQAIRDVLKRKTACQDAEGEESDDNEHQAPHDVMLQEFAGEGIPLLASAVPAETFFLFLNELLPLIMSKAKPSSTAADRCFSVGMLAETLQLLGGVTGGRAIAGQLSNQVLPVLVGGVGDSDVDVRSNSVFGLGVLAETAGPFVTQDYPMILFLFSSLMAKESNRKVIDNLCAALCRMIMTSVDSVPLDQVVPAVLTCLPLKEDLRENKTVFSCLAFLYTKNPSLVVSNMKTIVSASSLVLRNKNIDEETQSSLLLFLRNMAQHHAQEFEDAMMSLSNAERAAFNTAVTQS
ncbi:importin-4-like [Conger conger]|uniref:importin-4-like n=1 Tax=Conger conger TaxID=82655 RepID=UPI002A5A96BC|nr:importin-4-like [Conger conger]